MAANEECISPEMNICRLADRTVASPKISVDRDQGSWDSAGDETARSLFLFERTLMDSEKDLIDTFENVVHRDFPNPGRVGCPGHEVLAQLARLPSDIELSQLLAHVRKCAPCFDELRDLRKSQRDMAQF
jgi:hypothetical protein